MTVRANSVRAYKRRKGIIARFIESNEIYIHPNVLTLIQLPFIVISIWLFYNENLFSSFLILVIAWILDYFDGLMARLYNKHTQFGKFTDPLVDKIRFLVPLTLFFSHLVWLPLIVLFWLVESSLVITRIVKLISSKKKRKKARIGSFKVGQAKAWGEMIGLLLVFLFYMSELSLFIWLAYITLIPSFVLACLSFYNHATK